MMTQSLRAKRDSDLLLSANEQLEQLYAEKHAPCLALHISRNYHLLEENGSNSAQQNKWKEKAAIWWQLYWQSNANKGLDLFYDKSGPLFY